MHFRVLADASPLSRRFSTFQSSSNDQAVFLSLKIPLARLTDVSKVVNRNRRPRKLFFSFSFSFFFAFNVASVSLFCIRHAEPRDMRAAI